MKYFLAGLVFSLFSAQAIAAEWRVEGVYEGQNVFIWNPQRTTNSWCSYLIYLNDIQLEINLMATSIEIDLKSAGLKPGDTYVIKIVHHEDCKPSVDV